MKQILQVYDVELTVQGPVCIGSGREIKKKEYIYLPEEKCILIMDDVRFYRLIGQYGLKKEYEAFMLGKEQEDLKTWLEERHLPREAYMGCVRYPLDCGDIVMKSGNRISIVEYLKDAYGMPYVPGSSVKGMLRTILLCADVMHNSSDYTSIKRSVRKKAGETRMNLKRETGELESTCFRTLKRLKNRPNAGVNDILSGMAISDSKPLALEDLFVCQKTELNADGREYNIEVLREALRPGTRIRFQMTIDKSVCSITKADIEQAVSCFGEMYFQCFLRKFASVDKPKENAVWLGGGTGYATKTGVYPLFGEEEGVDIAEKIFEKSRFPKTHRHEEDRRFGVSPHVCKMTYYDKKRYQMGLCHLNIREHTG